MEIIGLKRSLLTNNSRIKKAIVDEIKSSLDIQPVGDDSYGLLKRIGNKLDYLIAMISSPVAEPTLPHPDNTNETTQMMVSGMVMSLKRKICALLLKKTNPLWSKPIS